MKTRRNLLVTASLALATASCFGQSTSVPVHRFADRTNLGLFAAVAATRAIDYHSTFYALSRGAKENNLPAALVSSKPVFAAFSAGAVAANVGVAYLLHRSAHHRLERIVSLFHVGVTLPSAVRNYSRRQVVIWTYPQPIK